ncbi:hypothetical protein BDV93DRAFT_14203 [Ceratobasidium sp. AG-I]|nr:hypothetical protein BDV93DRAFT_14203 [Ceratobasidium sp. AG-I]
MSPATSSTPRPQPTSSSASDVGLREAHLSSSGSSWSTQDTTGQREKEESHLEPSLDVRPRKRQRVSSTSQVSPPSNKTPQPRPLPRTHCDYPTRTDQDQDLSSNPRSHGVCQTCRKCQSNLLCSRCLIPTCSVCARTCTLAAISTPPTPLLCFSATPSPRTILNQLSAEHPSNSIDEIDVDDVGARLAISTSRPTAKRRSSTSTSASSAHREEADKDSTSWRLDEFGGCGQVVCQACAVEDSDSHESTCLDCLDGLGCPSLPLSI